MKFKSFEFPEALFDLFKGLVLFRRVFNLLIFFLLVCSHDVVTAKISDGKTN